MFLQGLVGSYLDSSFQIMVLRPKIMFKYMLKVILPTHVVCGRNPNLHLTIEIGYLQSYMVAFLLILTRFQSDLCCAFWNRYCFACIWLCFSFNCGFGFCPLNLNTSKIIVYAFVSFTLRVSTSRTLDDRIA